jgi:hypothetical protein
MIFLLENFSERYNLRDLIIRLRMTELEYPKQVGYEDVKCIKLLQNGVEFQACTAVALKS